MTTPPGGFAPAKGVGLAIAFDIITIANAKNILVFSHTRFRWVSFKEGMGKDGIKLRYDAK